jgi:hypothetical protein
MTRSNVISSKKKTAALPFFYIFFAGAIFFFDLLFWGMKAVSSFRLCKDVILSDNVCAHLTVQRLETLDGFSSHLLI